MYDSLNNQEGEDDPENKYYAQSPTNYPKPDMEKISE